MNAAATGEADFEFDIYLLGVGQMQQALLRGRRSQTRHERLREHIDEQLVFRLGIVRCKRPDVLTDHDAPIGSGFHTKWGQCMYVTSDVYQPRQIRFPTEVALL